MLTKIIVLDIYIQVLIQEPYNWGIYKIIH